MEYYQHSIVRVCVCIYFRKMFYGRQFKKRILCPIYLFIDFFISLFVSVGICLQLEISLFMVGIYFYSTKYGMKSQTCGTMCKKGLKKQQHRDLLM